MSLPCFVRFDNFSDETNSFDSSTGDFSFKNVNNRAVATCRSVVKKPTHLQNIRQMIVKKVELSGEMTCRQASKNFEVPDSTVTRMCSQSRKHGMMEIKRRGGNKLKKYSVYKIQCS